MAYDFGGLSFGPDFATQFYEGEPTAGLFDVFRGLGVGGTSPFGAFLRQSQPRYYQSYLSQLPQNPSDTYQAFLRRLNPQAEWGNMAPSQRGENTNAFGNRVRFLFNR